MGIIDVLTNYMGLLLGTLVILVVGAGFVYYYFTKVKKVSASEERIDYSSFRREDSTEYSKFKDIISSGNEHDRNAIGMIALGNNTFVSGISVMGYNYHSASAEERERTMINTVAFFNIVENPIQMHQTIQAIDLSENIEEEERHAQRIEAELVKLSSQYDEIVNIMQDNIDDDETYEASNQMRIRLERTIKSKQWQQREALEMIHYMKAISDSSSNSRKINQIMFSYQYNPDSDLEELSDVEIYNKALAELRHTAEIYGGALENCGCSWKVLCADDLTNLLRRHYHPETVDRIRLEDLLNSSYQSLYITSDSLEELEREKRGDIEYEQEMVRAEKEYEKRRQESILQFNNAKAIMENEAAAVQ